MTAEGLARMDERDDYRELDSPPDERLSTFSVVLYVIAAIVFVIFVSVPLAARLIAPHLRWI